MKKAIVKYSVIALSFCLLISCNNSTKDKTSIDTRGDTVATKEKEDTATTPTLSKEEKTTMPAANQQDYQYGPSVPASVITGTITTETFYGAPGYGENPETDKKEHPYLVILEKSVNIISTKVREDEYDQDTTVNNISKIQLIWPDGVDMAKLLNKKVRLTGTFFHAHTGHHHTDILMDVQKLDEL